MVGVEHVSMEASRSPDTQESIAALEHATKSGEAVRRIVGEYKDPFSLSIGREGHEWIYRLRVAVKGDALRQFPNTIELTEGDVRYKVRVIIHGGGAPVFAAREALRSIPCS